MTKLNLDKPFFLILCRSYGQGGGIYAPERAMRDMTSREETILDIITGQVENVVAVLESNPVEGTCRDVSEDIAREVARDIAVHGLQELTRRDLLDFVETLCGVGTVLPAVA